MTLIAKAPAWFRSSPVSLARLLPQMSVLLLRRGNQEELFNVLWILVFGFATLNILGMAARRFDSHRRKSLNFGEIMAILIVCLAVLLLGWEMLNLFHIFPIRLQLQAR